MTCKPPLRKTLCANASRRDVLAGLSASLALPACRSSKQSFDAEVLVLGAGLAGLNAALWLSEAGHNVLVLEGSKRIGGRLHTLDHGDGFTEAGGEQIGASYARCLDRAEALGLSLTDDPAQRPATLHAYEGQLYSPEDWRTANPLGLSGPLSGATPGAALFRTAATQNPLTHALNWQDVANDPSAETFLREAGFSEAALKAINHTLNGNDLSTYSIANLWRSLQLFSDARAMGPSKSIAGGAQRLPEAMAAALPRRVELEAPIRAISVNETAVEVTLQSGAIRRAPFAICALPFGALRRIDSEAPLPNAQSAAIAELPYTQIVQRHFRVDRAFWDDDGLPANMWTDTPYERVFMQQDASGAYTGFGRCWINGTTAASVDLSGFQDAMAAIRPSMAGTIEPLGDIGWTTANALSGGAYMHFAPGQIARWAKVMGQPAGRLHFAGEHLGQLHTGMEAAMESGEASAFALMERL